MDGDGVERIDDPEDGRLDPYRDVKDPEWVRRRGLFLAEGRSVVALLLRSGRFSVRSVVLTDAALRVLGDLALRSGAPVYRVERSTLDRVAGVRFHQGCVAAAGIPPPAAVEELLAAGGSRRWLVLEGLSDPDNVGGVFRNARALGVDAVALGPGCAHPLYRKATRTSMGATLEVPFASVPVWPEGLAPLRRAGFTLLALTPAADAADIRSFGSRRPLPDRIALLVGREGSGLGPAALAACDARVRIPMAPGTDSLNVATATGIALHRLAPEEAPC